MSLVDYSNLEEEIKNVPEMAILPAKTEARLRIVKVDHGVVEDEAKETYGAEYNMVTFDVPDEPNAPMFNHFMWDLAGAKDKLSEKQYMDALRGFKDFAEAFNIDYSRPFEWDEFVNLEGWAIIGIKKDKSGEYPDQNKVMSFVVPK